MKVGDLVRMRGAHPRWTWNGQMGIVTKIPRTTGGAWAILLTSGDLIATYSKNRMEVINGKES